MSASDLQIAALGNGRYRVSDGTRQRLAYAITAGDTKWVFFEGRAYALDAAPSIRRKAQQGHDETVLASPMPATVVLINVEPGQQVAQGDVLIMLEAMKMELAIKAPRDGRVAKVECRKGELVQPGIPLVELE